MSLHLLVLFLTIIITLGPTVLMVVVAETVLEDAMAMHVATMAQLVVMAVAAEIVLEDAKEHLRVDGKFSRAYLTSWFKMVGSYFLLIFIFLYAYEK